jgi:UDP-2,3-diacylglucosamine hydrolase
VERSLALMCGAGLLPARMAEEAQRRGWRVIAFAFDGAPDIADRVDRVVPARITALGPVLATLQEAGVSAALFSGRFSMPEIVRTDRATADAAARSLEAQAESRIDARLADVVIATLAGLGVEVLDQRDFLGEWRGGAGCWSARAPTDAEWTDVRRGLAVARLIADARVGQTVVVRHGAVVAVEAVEGTTETIRRGGAVGGPGAVVVKAVARDHDYRFDAPAVGPDTLRAARDARVSVVALEADRVLLVDRAEALRIADGAGIAVVGVDGGG